MKLNMKKIVIYILSTFILTWSMWGILATTGSGITSPAAQAIIAASMWLPSLGLLITWLLTNKERILGASLKPLIKKNVRNYLIAWFLPALLTALGSILFFMVFPKQFDPQMSSFYALMQPAMESGQIAEDMVSTIVIAQIIFAVTAAPFINIVFALGEEIGWRGFLYPALCKTTSKPKAILISGLIWGMWHAPITAMGHNYGLGYWGYPWMGIVAMCVFCVSYGAFVAYLTDKTGSIWPAALAHGAINACGGLPLYFVKDSTQIYQILGPAISGILAGIPLLCVGVVCIIKLRSEQVSES